MGPYFTLVPRSRIHRTSAAAAITVVAMFLLGCGDSTRSTGPSTPTSAAAVFADATQPHAAASTMLVNVHDACDSTTFNAAVGAGTCSRQGGVRFDDFIAQLTRNAVAGAWHFAPSQATAQLNQTLLAVNRGGEAHTFTQVAKFGGGIVPPLNQLSHNPVVAPECTTLEADDFVGPDGTYEQHIKATGTVQFQCCIHPWMRLTVQVPG
jgi:plastocyanin